MSKARKIPARIDHIKKEIVLNKWFEQKARYQKNKEYDTLLKYMNDFPTYTVRIRDDIDVKKNQEHYKGLTYEYMKRYIREHESKENVEAALSEFDEKIFISECHSKAYRYPVIKSWFLKKYPDVEAYGINKVEEIKIIDSEPDEQLSKAG